MNAARKKQPDPEEERAWRAQKNRTDRASPNPNQQPAALSVSDVLLRPVLLPQTVQAKSYPMEAPAGAAARQHHLHLQQQQLGKARQKLKRKQNGAKTVILTVLCQLPDKRCLAPKKAGITPAKRGMAPKTHNQHAWGRKKEEKACRHERQRGDRLLWTALDPRWPITEWQLLFFLVTTTQQPTLGELEKPKNSTQRSFYSMFTRRDDDDNNIDSRLDLRSPSNGEARQRRGMSWFC